MTETQASMLWNKIMEHVECVERLIKDNDLKGFRDSSESLVTTFARVTGFRPVSSMEMPHVWEFRKIRRSQ